MIVDRVVLGRLRLAPLWTTDALHGAFSSPHYRNCTVFPQAVVGGSLERPAAALLHCLPAMATAQPSHRQWWVVQRAALLCHAVCPPLLPLPRWSGDARWRAGARAARECRTNAAAIVADAAAFGVLVLVLAWCLICLAFNEDNN